MSMQASHPSHFPPPFTSLFSTNGEEKTLINNCSRTLYTKFWNLQNSCSMHATRERSAESDGWQCAVGWKHGSRCWLLQQKQRCGHCPRWRGLSKDTLSCSISLWANRQVAKQEALAAGPHRPLTWVISIKRESSVEMLVPQAIPMGTNPTCKCSANYHERD